jgi:hypothetical protein
VSFVFTVFFQFGDTVPTICGHLVAELKENSKNKRHIIDKPSTKHRQSVSTSSTQRQRNISTASTIYQQDINNMPTNNTNISTRSRQGVDEVCAQ